MNLFKKNVRVRVAGIILNDDKVLLIAHKKKKNIYWLLPGGGVNYGESLEDALRREFIEELNITIEVGKPVLICDSIDPDGKRHIVNICFICDCKNGTLQLGDDHRLYDFKYFSKDDLPDITLFPPINSDLEAIMGNGEHLVYLGKLWLDIMKQ